MSNFGQRCRIFYFEDEKLQIDIMTLVDFVIVFFLFRNDSTLALINKNVYTSSKGPKSYTQCVQEHGGTRNSSSNKMPWA